MNKKLLTFIESVETKKLNQLEHLQSLHKEVSRLFLQGVIPKVIFDRIMDDIVGIDENVVDFYEDIDNALVEKTNG